ncbi:MAG: C-GCAxxG-C-C family (seleno)protein [Thomasclavelia sp.]|jgi:C_GCAxxG_C_C family probable redox protein|nr:C-GCAxxG-C-C family (seleno)protein [Thomasclavelia sp.]
MLKDDAIKYYKEGYNCAESIIRGANDYYDLKLHDHDMKMVAAFGIGLQVGDTCGALNSAACVISSKYIETKAHDNPRELQKITSTLVKSFEDKMGSRLCPKVRAKYFTPELRCQNTVSHTCDILETVINDCEASK